MLAIWGHYGREAYLRIKGTGRGPGVGKPQSCWWSLPSLLFLVLQAGAVYADLSGSPPHVSLVPDIDVYPQNFDIAQDGASILYVANSDGVLVFDGDRWKLVPMPNGNIVRSLRYDGHERVYVGGYDAFGYIERDETGEERFHDLTPLYSELLDGEAFADIWDLYVAPEGVFFRAVKHLFLYEPETGAIRLWRYPDRFGAITRHQGEMLLQFRGKGLKRLKAGEWELVAGSESLTQLIYELLPLPGGGLLVLSVDGRWREYRDGKVYERPMPAGLPSSSQFSVGRVLADGTLALGSDDGMLYVLDTVNGRFQNFRIHTGRLSGITVATAGGLLAAGNEAVFHVSWPTRWSLLGSEHGVAGTVRNVARWGDRWYALTGAGVYETVTDAGNPRTRFQRRNWTDHEAWDLLALDNDHALLADSYTLKLVAGTELKPLTHDALYPRLLRRSRFDPSVVYVGTEFGLGVMRHEKGRWRLRLDADDMQHLRVQSLVEIAPHELWIGSQRGGVQLLRLAQDYSRIVDARRMEADDGIAYGREPDAHVASRGADELVASTGAGFYRWDGRRFERVELDGLEALRNEGELLQLAFAPNGDQWAYSHYNAYRRSKSGSWQREKIGDVRRGALQNLAFTPQNGVLLGTSSAILSFDGQQVVAAGSPPNVMLRAVSRIEPDGTAKPLSLRRDRVERFTQDDFGIMFRFALPDYRRKDAVRYQARLAGFEERFSDWAQGTYFTYTRLRPGQYRFELRARDSLGRITEIAPFLFIIEPRWYASPWAWAIWAMLLLAMIAAGTFAVVRARTRRLTGEKFRLENMVAERTRELESANRQLEMMAHLDGLTGIPNRRRLDDYLEQVWAYCEERSRPVSVLVIDVDRFKEYNDMHGHVAGDDLLKRLAKTLTHCLRRTEDLVARYGGEEFLAVLPGADLVTACELADTMRHTVEESSLGATISIGVASRRPQSGVGIAVLVRTADDALYEAKAAGRNCVIAAPG